MHNTERQAAGTHTSLSPFNTLILTQADLQAAQTSIHIIGQELDEDKCTAAAAREAQSSQARLG